MVTTECVIEKGEGRVELVLKSFDRQRDEEKVLIGKGMKKKYFKWIVGIMSEHLLRI